MKSNNHVSTQIKNGNLWYTEEQLPTMDNPAVANVVKQRWMFIQSILLDLSIKERPITVLDAGCGDGVNLKFLTSLAGIDVSGFDYNPVRVERATQSFPDATIQQADLTDLSEVNERFDCILLSQVLEHIPDDLDVLKQLASKLTPQGQLIVGVPNEGCALARLRNNVLFPDYAKTTDHIHFYTPPHLKDLFSEAGLTINHTLVEGFFYPTIRMYQFFSAGKWRFTFSQWLGRVFPSLAAGFYFSLSPQTSRIKRH